MTKTSSSTGSGVADHRPDQHSGRSPLRPAPVLSSRRPRLGDDDRMDLAATAAGRDNRNRPVLLPVLAVLALLACGIYAGITHLQLARAKVSELASARWTGDFRSQLNTYTKLVASGHDEKTAVDVYAPVTDFLSKMESAWSFVGLADSPPQPRESTNPLNNETDPNNGQKLGEYKIKYTNISVKEIAPVMDWIERGLDSFSGAELSILEMQVQPNQGWRIAVEFRRIQRAR